jgi:hypothetical protein
VGKPTTPYTGRLEKPLPSTRNQNGPCFRVIDLDSQADAVARHIRGWSRDEVLAWLGRYGKIKRFPHNADLYSFLAPSGLLTGFVLREGGEFLIIVDHTTYSPRG